MARATNTKMLDWLDGRSAVQFVAILYAARWVAVVPVMVLSRVIWNDAQEKAPTLPGGMQEIGSGLALAAVVLMAPLLETLIECALPYLVVSRIRKHRLSRPGRSWGFVAISACMMAILHPMAAAVVPSLITGAFLAYCYAHFAARSTWQAIAATACFHGAINVVGWIALAA